ncbi:aldo/keto reductase family protein [Polycladidibacter hongkongensis]|uniref:aldo/keto reductase family protein n=1 Tax=Polycladidibacter hongkongensis TaxID=1647556 RepID=UPI00082DF362|nr:aldo/keto reductase [Pseudovibrio hongkongensis]
MSSFKLSENAVDQSVIPTKTLANGVVMPAIGMGTFGSDRFTADDIANAVLGGAAAGFRFFDCAAVYENEPQIGNIFKEMMTVIPRDELFIDSKVWNDQHKNVVAACKQTLHDLQLDYLDLYLTHWPFPNYHAPGCDVDSRSPDAVPYRHEQFMETWAQMEELVDMGLVRSIGTSNMTIPKMELLLRDARIKPVVNEMECHPHFQQQELYSFLTKNGVQPIGFCPIGSPTRPDRDMTENDTVDIEDPVIVAAAKRLGVHPAVVCIKWAVQRGHVPIPFSIHENEYTSNLRCITENPLTTAEMEAISKIDKNCRLIKGQVFLWESANDWEDLWDLDGKIAG